MRAEFPCETAPPAEDGATVDITQLRYFLKIAEKENFSRAAEELRVSQPALSRAIARLEQELGRPVFERLGRRVGLTETGRLLQTRAQQIVALIEDAKAEITDDGESGRVRVAAIPTIAPFYLPGLLREFAVMCPNASVLVQEDVTSSALKRCSQGDVDIALLALPISARYLEVEELFEEELLLVLPVGHPLNERRKIRLADVEPYPFVLLDEAHCLSENIVSFCHQRSFQPVVVERTSQLATVQELVALGHGVSLVPNMARVLDESERRVYRSLDGARPTRKIAMVWNPYRFQSKLMIRFRDHVRDYAQSTRHDA